MGVDGINVNIVCPLAWTAQLENFQKAYPDAFKANVKDAAGRTLRRCRERDWKSVCTACITGFQIYERRDNYIRRRNGT